MTALYEITYTGYPPRETGRERIAPEYWKRIGDRVLLGDVDITRLINADVPKFSIEEEER
jgi:hypothetical protein